jgi:hypothetical protein
VVDGNASELIDNNLTLTISSSGESYILIATSSGWVII